MLEKELAEKECLNVGEQGAQAFIAIYSFANYTISCLVTRITFAHKLSYELRKTLILRLCADSGGYVGFPLKSVTLCPSLGSPTSQVRHSVLHVIPFLNSCLNLLIYWYHHKEYKRGFMMLFCMCKMHIVPSLAPSDSFYIGRVSRLKTRTSKLRTPLEYNYHQYHQYTTVLRTPSYRV